MDSEDMESVGGSETSISFSAVAEVFVAAVAVPPLKKDMVVYSLSLQGARCKDILFTRLIPNYGNDAQRSKKNIYIICKSINREYVLDKHIYIINTQGVVLKGVSKFVQLCSSYCKRCAKGGVQKCTVARTITDMQKSRTEKHARMNLVIDIMTCDERKNAKHEGGVQN